MQLKLSRSQKNSLTGKVLFQLHAQAILTREEEQAIQRFKLGKEVVWAKNKVDPAMAMSGIGAIGRLAAAAALNVSITVNDLAQGRSFECKEITDMLAIQHEIHQACEVLVSILDAAMHFDGNELIDIHSQAA